MALVGLAPVRRRVRCGAEETMEIDYRREELDAFQVETVSRTTVAALGVAIGTLFVAAFVFNPIEYRLAGAVAALAAVAAAAQFGLRHGGRLAGATLSGGLAILLGAAALLWPVAVVAPWSCLVVLVTGTLLGGRAATAAAIGATGVLLAMARQAADQLSADAALGAILLCWASLLLFWLSSQSLRTAMEWAWSSYSEARRFMTEARERQAELGRVVKSLNESYYRLEQLNLELERARRAAQEARRLKERFATAVSHELRTPLNLIIGFCEMMVLSPATAYGERLPRGYQADLEAIYRNASHISALVDDILDLSQIEADRMALHKEWTSIERIAQEAVATVEMLFHHRELTLRVEVLGDPPAGPEQALPSVFVDRTRARQILINLLTNAARVTERGGVTLRAERVPDGIVVAVCDTGPGIPPEDIPYVFEEFRQFGDPLRRRSGSGLGLTISRRFAELHGGTMWLESSLGEGSTFYLKLPLGVGDQPRMADGAAWDQWRASRIRGRPDQRVVVVDETGQAHRIFQRYLDGYTVEQAPDVERCREIIRALPVQAVLLGSPAAEAAWREAEAASDEPVGLPVVSCSLRTARCRADELGVADYLVKPVRRDQLRSALRRLGGEVHSALVVDDEPEMTRLLARMVR